MSFDKDLENSTNGLTGRKTFTCLNSSEESEWLCGNLLGQLVVVVRQDEILQLTQLMTPIRQCSSSTDSGLMRLEYCNLEKISGILMQQGSTQ